MFCQQASTGADKEELEFNFDEEDSDFAMHRTPTGRQGRRARFNTVLSDSVCYSEVVLRS